MVTVCRLGRVWTTARSVSGFSAISAMLGFCSAPGGSALPHTFLSVEGRSAEPGVLRVLGPSVARRSHTRFFTRSQTRARAHCVCSHARRQSPQAPSERISLPTHSNARSSSLRARAADLESRCATRFTMRGCSRSFPVNSVGSASAGCISLCAIAQGAVSLLPRGLTLLEHCAHLRLQPCHHL